MLTFLVHAERKEELEPMEDEGSILRKMRRLTDYYDVHKEIGRYAIIVLYVSGCEHIDILWVFVRRRESHKLHSNNR